MANEQPKRMGFFKKLVLSVVAISIVAALGGGVLAKVTGNQNY